MSKVKLDDKGRIDGPPPSADSIPNPDLLRKDPMAEIFGPGSGVKLIGDPDDQIPDEVRAVLDEFGLSKKPFQCVLKEIPEGSDIGDQGASTNTQYIKGWVRGIPSVDYIAKNYGPGLYLLQFTWRIREEDENGKNVSKAYHQEVTVPISQKAAGDYKKHRLDRKLREANEISTQVQEAMLEKNLENAALKGVLGDKDESKQNPAQAAKQYIAETMEAAKMIGLSPLSSLPAPRVIEWEKILPAVVGGITAFLQMQQTAENSRREEFNKLLMLMMSQSQNASKEFMEIMKAQSGVGSGNMAIREFKDMVLGALDIKEALSGNQKEGLADKIFRVIEGVAPQILSIAATTAEARAAQNHPMVKVAKNYVASNPDFVALKNNPAELKKEFEKLDDFFGWRQTDIITQVMGWERPQDCLRDPVKENAPQLPMENDEPADAMTS
jgi:hypothetical protein